MESQEREIASALASDVPEPTGTAPPFEAAQQDGAHEAEARLLPGGFHAFKPTYGDDSSPVTNTQRPNTDAVITVRVIKSFEYRTMKALVLKSVDLTKMTVEELKERCRAGKEHTSEFFYEADTELSALLAEIKSTPSFKALRSAVASLGEYIRVRWKALID
jgi:Uncharacterized conserved protein (DUF2340)